MTNLIAKDIMNRDVLKVNADWSLGRLADFLIENSISGAPVISGDGSLIGVVTLVDIIRHDTQPEKSPKSNGPHEYYIHSLENRFAQQEIESFHLESEPLFTVSDIMTPIIFKVNEDTSVQETAGTMIKSRIHRVFVTSEEKVVGIISSADMLRIIRDMD